MSEVAHHVVGLVVPRFADFAMVWAVNRDGALEPLASTHARWPAAPWSSKRARAAVEKPRPPGLTDVVEQGQSILSADVSPSTLEGLGEAQRARAMELNVRTVMTVPLAVAGRHRSGP